MRTVHKRTQKFQFPGVKINAKYTTNVCSFQEGGSGYNKYGTQDGVDKNEYISKRASFFSQA
jgi:hypothetical protein